ncbi:MAG: S-layer homology domain-containing protein [Clostridia bacterium]|nr:S-layer homology domain-containing protein [Clostridia bacterium]
MKNTNRILSLLLAVCMLVSCIAIGVFADDTTTTAASGTKFSDVTANSLYATAVTTLNQMGVINGYPDGTFGPDQNVTRAEFTAMLMRTLNYGSLGSSGTENLPFTDIDVADTGISWAIPNINIAYDMGIINGYAEDNTFRPRNNVSYEEALKMIVCALGYTGIETSGTPWYALYLAQANKLGITEFASQFGAPETPATRACIAQMLYDSLDVNLCKDGEVTGDTILSSYLGYIKNTGLISSDGTTSLTKPDVVLNANEIQIYAQDPFTYAYETQTYKAKDVNLRKYLGYEIEYYYKTDGVTRDLSFYVLSPSNELTLDASMIETSGSTSSQVRYYKSETASSTTALNLDSDNVVIYNGKLYGANPAASKFNTSMIPKVGTITFLDSDKDNSYDLIKIQAYEIYYVASKVSAEYSIIDDVTRRGESPLVLNVDNGAIETKIVDANGNTMNYSSISVGNIICLAKTNPANGGEVLQTAVVVKNSVTGKVTASKAGESITVNGNVYKYSEAAPWMPGGTGLLTEPQMHDTATFYMDINGKVVAYKKDANTASIPYGYIMGAGTKTGTFSDTIPVKVLSQDGKKQELSVTGDTYVDGQKPGSAQAVIDALALTNSGINTDASKQNVTIQQPIKYTTRVSNGTLILDRIYTIAGSSYDKSKGQTIVSDKLFHYNNITAAKKATYAASGNKLTVNGTTVSASGAIVFVVPTDRSKHDNYTKTTASGVFHANSSDDYFVEAFDVSTANAAKLIVYYRSEQIGSVNDYTPISIVAQDIVYSSNNGENMGLLKGYKSSYVKPKDTLDAWLSPKSDTVNFGDIFRYATDSDGNAVVENQHILYKAAGGNTYGILSPSNSSKFDSTSTVLGVMLGSIVTTDDSNVTIYPGYLEAKPGANLSSIYAFDLSQFASAQVLKYTLDNNGKLVITDVSSEYNGAIRSATNYNNGMSNPTKVLVYLYKGSPKLLVLLDSKLDPNPAQKNAPSYNTAPQATPTPEPSEEPTPTPTPEPSEEPAPTPTPEPDPVSE